MGTSHIDYYYDREAERLCNVWGGWEGGLWGGGGRGMGIMTFLNAGIDNYSK